VEIAPAAAKGDEGLHVGVSGLAELLDRFITLARLPVLRFRSFADVAKDMKACYRLVWMGREMRAVVDPAEAGFLIGDEQRCPGLCPGRAR
jgi:hypothetical protein